MVAKLQDISIPILIFTKLLLLQFIEQSAYFKTCSNNNEISDFSLSSAYDAGFSSYSSFRFLSILTSLS